MTNGTTQALSYQPRLRAECQTEIRVGQKIRISMPSGMPEKYPRFSAVYNGRKGTVVEVFPTRPNIIVVDVTIYPRENITGIERLKAGIHVEWIRVERAWLSHEP